MSQMFCFCRCSGDFSECPKFDLVLLLCACHGFSFRGSPAMAIRQEKKEDKSGELGQVRVIAGWSEGLE